MMVLYRWLWTLLPGNPMVVRIVQGGSRRWRHQWVRMGYLGGLVFLVVIGLLSGEGIKAQASLTELAKSGTKIFGIVSYGQVILVCLLAPLFMAAAIGREKQGQTYDILLTTPLSNLQLILGSLMGRLFFVLALLLSGLPLFSVVLIFGGVPVGSVFVSFVVAGLSALVVGTVAVTLSVFRAGGRKAVFLFMIAVATYLVASYFLDVSLLRSLAGAAIGVEGATTWLTPLHPLLVLEASLNRTDYQLRPPESLVQYGPIAKWYLGRPLAAFATLSLLFSATMILLNAMVLRRIGQGGLLGSWGERMRQRLRIGGGQDQERRRPARQVWANPIAWREANTRGNRAGGILARWGFAAAGLLAAGALLACYHFQLLPQITDASTGGFMKPHVIARWAILRMILVELAVIVLVAIYMSAGCVSREREDGTLDLLLTTPITPKQYIWGKLRGLVSFLAVMLAVPVLTLSIFSVYSLLGQYLAWDGAIVSHDMIDSQGATVAIEMPLMLPEVSLWLGLMLVPFVALSVMVGMTWSLKAKGVMGAVVPTVGVIGCVGLVTASCGLTAATEIPVVGVVVNAFSPATNIITLIDPWQYVYGYIDNSYRGRLALGAGAVAAGGVYCLLVYSMRAAAVKSFDQTVRRLSGTGG